MAGEANNVGAGDDLATVASKGKVKFFCSHGGKILIRPTDGRLKYVGGVTRVIAIARDITFLELMKKLTGSIGGNMVLKYQVLPEDLDTLVTVKTDRDLKFMFDKHDGHGSEGTPRLRTFLFTAPVMVADHSATTTTLEPHALEQRYLDAINGLNNTTPTMRFAPRKFSEASSSCSSPRSLSPLSNRPSMHRVKSSPSVAYHSHTFHHDAPQSSRLPPDLPNGDGMGKLGSALSSGRAAAKPFSRQCSKNRHHGQCRDCSLCANHEEGVTHMDGQHNRVESCPQSHRHIIWE